ncbi:MAG: YihY/virulence factor BrkB family protein [Clostridia bacterium]|nr:YihY/virulence factor BrkB family protein [Clostridia bacterium]NCC44735.1 YihY/virulence factor BrkB family protein [Clostridia bacterium]
MKKCLKIISGFLGRLNEDHVGAFAAQAAYFMLLSFVPFLMLLLTMIQYTPVTQNMVTTALLQIMPDTGDFRNFFLNIIQEIYGKSTAVVPISAVLTLWSAGKGVQALTNGVNAIYHVEETRNYFVTRLRSALYTLVFIIAVVGSLILLVFGNSIQKMLTRYIPVLAKITAYIIGMRAVISIGILMLVFLMIYKILPNRKASLKNQFPGAIISAVSWSLFSLGFSMYIDISDGLSNMYGSLTTIILTLLWLYFCMFIVLIGAEINAYFEERIKRFRKIASAKIREEYREFIGGFHGNDHDDDDDDDQGSGEARQARH